MMSQHTELDYLASAYPHLQQFFGGYFHQDWTQDSDDSWEGVVDGFIADSTSESVDSAVAELTALLGTGLDSTQLRRLLDQWDCNVDPTAWSMSPAVWLEAVLARLRRG